MLIDGIATPEEELDPFLNTVCRNPQRAYERLKELVEAAARFHPEE